MAGRITKFTSTTQYKIMNSPILSPVTTTATPTTTLSAEDTALLHSLEKRVAASSLDCFTALAEIEKYKGGLLWKATHGSFEEYVRVRFQYKPQHIGRLLGAGNLTLQLKSEMEKPEDLPVNEAQLRPLLNKIPADRQVEAWKKVVAELKPEERTGPKVMEKVKEIRKSIPKKELEAAKPERAPKTPRVAVSKTAVVAEPKDLISDVIRLTAGHKHNANIRQKLEEVLALLALPEEE